MREGIFQRRREIRIMLRKNRGFTLAELLIVLVVIGILSAMMMMTSNEAVSSARVATILADLTNLKKALMVWHTDNYDRIEHDPASDNAGMIRAKSNNKDNRDYNPIQETNVMDEIAIYLEGTKLNKGKRQRSTGMSEGSYGIYDGGGDTAKNRWSGLPKGVKTGRLAWFVGYSLTKSERDVIVKKLKGREKTLGLVYGGRWPNEAWGSSGYYTIWIRVL